MNDPTLRSDAELLAQARDLGLDRLVEQFSDDVLVAARVAHKLKATYAACEDVTTEIWPPMTVRGQA